MIPQRLVTIHLSSSNNISVANNSMQVTGYDITMLSFRLCLCISSQRQRRLTNFIAMKLHDFLWFTYSLFRSIKIWSGLCLLAAVDLPMSFKITHPIKQPRQIWINNSLKSQRTDGIYGWEQDCSNSIANALGLQQPCANPLIWSHYYKADQNILYTVSDVM